MLPFTFLPSRLLRFLFCGLLVGLLSASAAFAQLKIYAKFENGTNEWAGTSLASGRSNWVELEGLSLSSSNTVSFGSAGPGASVGKVNFEDALFVKSVDRLTPQIFLSLAQGSTLENLVVEFVSTLGPNPAVVFRVEFKLVAFTSLSTDSADGESQLRENVKFAYGAMRLTHWPINSNGTLGTPVTRAWNRVRNNSTFTDL
jgi:type VI protein secretion system component Hcp